MYDSIYDSPFPKINPKVRYKTALERAGFDTKPRNLFSSQRNASTGSLQASVSSPPMSVQRNVSAAPFVPVITKSTYTVSSKGNQLFSKGESDIYSPPVLDNSRKVSIASSKNSNKISSSRPSNKSHPSQDDPFRFERGPEHHQERYTAPRYANESSIKMHSQVTDNSLFNFEQIDVSNSRKEQDLSPIEKSFMMLTQNDTASFTNSMSQMNNERTTGQELEEEQQQISANHQEVEPEEEEEEEEISVNYQKMGPEEEEEKEYDVESLNFEPQPELHVNLDENLPLPENTSQPQEEEDVVPRIPEINVTRGKTTPQLFISTSYNSGSIDSKLFSQDIATGFATSKEGKSPDVLPSSPSVENLDFDASNEKRYSTASSEKVETPYTATNLQVEQLIAQLDDVSLSRNARLDQNENSLNLVDRKTSRFKKSSAYLSGYGGLDIPATQQTSIMRNIDGNVSNQSFLVDNDDVNDDVPSTSTTNGGTPIFYKFKQSTAQYSGDEGNLSQETFKAKPPIIEALQLQHKPSITNLREDADNSRPTDPRVSPTNGTVEYSPDVNYHENEPMEFKYPPGEGPCRACGLEVTGKRMFSKKENELSGQWHRECFKCIECAIKFNKRVPCYILRDTPYCQKHYHEENHSICKVCSNYIEGECLENDKVERFHVDCLNCFLCKTAITNDYYIFNGEIPLCGKHDIDALLKEGIDNDASGSDRNNTVSKRRTRLINFK
ncbi:hypothetical protein SEUBUCD646_0K03050 [Saccharomyces eubayanus]|uniref:LIM zinc-binding domain-containing protein n=2 Tax=Saccharomyces TaxID=4930 RepID=A0ABN8VEQ7_SACEU|nr:hypothetical protein SEUBUCD650_0K03040 [Saccharomyces eubayanus]CAI1582306.1 hypothetical protein SEUBUCD646_0K03050 [Saccharomyces eubayanus]